jgi:hypothetical protein
VLPGQEGQNYRLASGWMVSFASVAMGGAGKLVKLRDFSPAAKGSGASVANQQIGECGQLPIYGT